MENSCCVPVKCHITSDLPVPTAFPPDSFEQPQCHCLNRLPKLGRAVSHKLTSAAVQNSPSPFASESQWCWLPRTAVWLQLEQARARIMPAPMPAPLMAMGNLAPHASVLVLLARALQGALHKCRCASGGSMAHNGPCLRGNARARRCSAGLALGLVPGIGGPP